MNKVPPTADYPSFQEQDAYTFPYEEKKQQLIKLLVEDGILYFAESNEEIRNKSDSPSCLGQPRRPLSNPETLEVIIEMLAYIVLNKCSSRILAGIVSTGSMLALGISLELKKQGYKYPMIGVRLVPEMHKEQTLIFGKMPEEMNEERRCILVDDLIFHGTTKKQAIITLQAFSFEITDMIVIVDRQLQRKFDGPPIHVKYGFNFHTLVTMDDIVQYMIKENLITDIQLQRLITDYRAYERWDLPDFAK